jgi:hypothetical protein
MGSRRNVSNARIVRLLSLCFFAIIALLVPNTSAQQNSQNDVSTSEQSDREAFGSWLTHSHDAPHTGVSWVESQPLQRIHWHARVDLHPQITFGDLFIHYGSPLVYREEYSRRSSKNWGN